jgi:hypothetical protein
LPDGFLCYAPAEAPAPAPGDDHSGIVFALVAGRIRSSVITDASRFTGALESACREMWARWCRQRR